MDRDAATDDDVPTSQSATSGVEPFDLSGYVRRARRLGDFSQRELAAAVGVDQAMIARVECGGDMSVESLARVLAASGLRLQVVDAASNPVEPMPRDVFRDRAGRRRPAHLDVYSAPTTPTTRMLLHDGSPVAPGEAWHHERRERDRIRRRDGVDGAAEQLTVGETRARRALVGCRP